MVIEVLTFERSVQSSWRMDETAVSVRGGRFYLYRAVDKRGKTVGSLLCADRSMFAAEEFFRQAVIGVVYRTISGCLLKSAGLTRATGQAARMRRRGRQRVSRRRERRPLQYSRARSRSGRGRWFTSRC